MAKQLSNITRAVAPSLHVQIREMQAESERYMLFEDPFLHDLAQVCCLLNLGAKLEDKGVSLLFPFLIVW